MLFEIRKTEKSNLNTEEQGALLRKIFQNPAVNTPSFSSSHDTQFTLNRGSEITEKESESLFDNFDIQKIG